MEDTNQDEEERARVQGIYNAARIAAMAEYDALESKWNEMSKRMGSLRRLINSASELTNTEVEERFGYDHIKNSYIGQRDRIVGGRSHLTAPPARPTTVPSPARPQDRR